MDTSRSEESNYVNHLRQSSGPTWTPPTILVFAVSLSIPHWPLVWGAALVVDGGIHLGAAVVGVAGVSGVCVVCFGIISQSFLPTGASNWKVNGSSSVNKGPGQSHRAVRGRPLDELMRPSTRSQALMLPASPRHTGVLFSTRYRQAVSLDIMSVTIV